jgi:hypothetical protein
MNYLRNAIRNFSQTEEEKTEIPINQQTKFIETYSNNLINFVYKSVPKIIEQFSKNNLYRFDIIRNRTLTTNIYDVICHDSRQIIMYFVIKQNPLKKKKKFDIFLNYNFNLPVSNILYENIILEIFSFLPRQFNKTHKNGLYIGSVETDWNYKYFNLNIDESKLPIKHNKLYSKNIYSAEQYFYPNSILMENYLPQIKETKIFMNNNMTHTTNIRPIWNEELQIYTLRDYGRIRNTSTKNTSFVDKYYNKIAIFGRSEFEDEYVLDFKNMSLIQAVSLAITCLQK